MSHGMKSVTNFSFLGFWLVGFVSFFQVITENLVLSLYMHGLVLNLTTFQPISLFPVSQGHLALTWTWVLPPNLIPSADFITRLFLFETSSCMKF